jgi:hypothetical protein
MKLKMASLLDVATIEERAISNKVYPAHSITLQISATRVLDKYYTLMYNKINKQCGNTAY